MKPEGGGAHGQVGRPIGWPASQWAHRPPLFFLWAALGAHLSLVCGLALFLLDFFSGDLFIHVWRCLISRCLLLGQKGHLALLFCMLVMSVLCRIFVRCIPSPLVSVPVQNLKKKYGTNKKGILPDWNPGSSNFIILK